MSKKIKSFFLAFNNFKKKGLVLALLFLVIIGLVLPINKALADWWNPFTWGTDIANAVGSAVLKLVGLIFFGVPLFLSAIFVGITALLLGWVISPDFISLKFTQNAFVNIGLSITKGFANMGFILFLVVIALATILRIEEYKAKKTLPTLILIALLVNFSPVLCGVVIDFTNIVMKFFTDNITGLTGFAFFLGSATKELYNLLIGSGFDFWQNVSTFMQIFISIIVNCYAGYIFILFSALFIMRYIMLWILVILSPIAFVSYILPITRRGGSILSWRKWWEQLISWCIIGIIAGFFLYLGFTMIAMINAAPSTFVTYPDLSWGGTGLGLMNNILPYLIPLILLFIARRETERTSAMFAKEVIEMPGKVAKAAVQVGAIALTAGAAAGFAAGALGKAAAGAQRLEGAMGKVPILGKPLKYGVGRPISWATRGAERAYVPPLLEYAAKQRKVKISDEFDKMTPEEQPRYVRTKTTTPQERIQYANRMVEKDTLKYAGKEFQEEVARDSDKLAENPHYKKEVDTIRRALPDKVTAKMMIDFEVDPDKKDQMIAEISDIVDKSKGKINMDDAAVRIMVKKLKYAEDMPKIASKDFWENEHVMHAMQNEWKGGQIGAAARKFESQFIEAFTNKMEKDIADMKSNLSGTALIKEFEIYVKRNTARARYLETTAARELGFASLWERAPDEVRNKYKSMKHMLENI